MSTPEYKKEWYKKDPWKNHFKSARYRCNYPTSKKYKNYGGRGIQFLLTLAQVKRLWFRDKAYNLKTPSIDRKNTDGNYTYGNCRFIERDLNTRKGRKIIRINPLGVRKEYPSLISAAKALGLGQKNTGNILNCAKGMYHTMYGYKWSVVL